MRWQGLEQHLTIVLCRFVAIVDALIVIFSFAFVIPSWEFKCISWSNRRRLVKKVKEMVRERKRKHNV